MRIKTLIIDDDKEFSDALSHYLTQEGFDVESVTDPKRAMDKLKSAMHHVVLLDLKMPAITGDDLLVDIRKFDSDVSVIVVTGYPSTESAVTTMKLGVTDYITKPFRMPELLDVIQKALAERGLEIDPDEKLASEIGQRIRALRQEKGLTIKQLANRTGLSLSLISKIELGDSSASISTLRKLASALKVHISYFFLVRQDRN